MHNLLVAGGDRRMLHLAELLEKDGWAVETLGLRENESIHINRADAVLLPYPFSQRNGLIPVLTGDPCRVQDVLSKARRGITVLAGRGMEDDGWQESFCIKRYTDAGGFEMRNAALSAEAAVCECMLHSSMALMDESILVTGYGLFGRALALRLKALGARVYVAARRAEQRSLAESEGMHSLSMAEMDRELPEMDVILNSVPARILNEDHLRRMKKNVRLLELASAPYGFDPETARKMGIDCAVLPGLPGRYSPLSAALALRESVNMLLGRGVE